MFFCRPPAAGPPLACRPAADTAPDTTPAGRFGGALTGVRRARRSAGCKTSGMRITVLAGGVGAARFLRGLLAAAPGAEITVIGNTGDDITLFGLHVSPDLDTVMYTLGGGISEERGWGRDGETFAVLPELAAYGAGPDWFTLGDRDFATHITRTALLRDGATLSQATARLCQRWQPGVTLLPMSDDPVQTHVVLAADEPGENGGGTGGGADRPLPGMVGAAAGRGAGPADHRHRGRPGPARAGRAGRHRGGRLRPVPAVQSGGQHRDDPGRAGDRGGGGGPDRGRGVADHRRTRRCTAWPTPAWPRSACPPRRRRSPPTTVHPTTGRLLDGWLVDDSGQGGHRRTRNWTASRSGRCPCT